VGRVASAWASFGEAADMAKRAGQSDRESIARDRANALVPKLSKLRIRYSAQPLPPGFELRYDGKALSTAALDTEMPVDPGEHRVGASAPGRVPTETSVRVDAGGGNATVDLPLMAEAPSHVADAPIEGPLPAPPPRAEGGGSSWQKPAAIGAGAGAIVALTVGTIFGLKASSQWSDAQKTCPGNRCDDAGYQGWHDARSSATIGTVGFVAGGVLAAAAVVLFVTAKSGSPATPASAGSTVSPWRIP
jgi:hypothetical protein